MYLSSIESRATTPVGCHRNTERVKASAQTMGSRDDAQGKAQFNQGSGPSGVLETAKGKQRWLSISTLVPDARRRTKRYALRRA